MCTKLQNLNMFQTDFDLPTYEDALLMNEEIDVSLQNIEDSFAQMLVKSTKK